jgi:methionine synthase II (cobalamin-independent)
MVEPTQRSETHMTTLTVFGDMIKVTLENGKNWLVDLDNVTEIDKSVLLHAIHAIETISVQTKKTTEMFVGVKMIDSKKKLKWFIIGGAAADLENQERIKKAMYKIYSDQAIVCSITKEEVNRLEDSGYEICVVDDALIPFAR